MGMGMHKIVKQMEKVDFKNRTKIVTPEKWLTMTSNWKHYEHPPIAPPNVGANLTLLEHHEPLFHACHNSLYQIDED